MRLPGPETISSSSPTTSRSLWASTIAQIYQARWQIASIDSGQMRILVLHKYGPKAASFRHRIQQYLPYLERAGFTCDVSSLLDDAYLESRFRTGRRSPWGAVQAVARRLRAFVQVKRYDLVFIGLEFFPYCPAIFERLLNLLRVPFIFDFDDSVFHYYDLHKWAVVRWALGGKIAEVARRSALVFAGSPYLLEYASHAGGTAIYIPTVIDLNRYSRVKKRREPGAPFIIGWIGSPTTAQYLHLIKPALRAFCISHPAKLVTIGTGPFALEGIPIESRPWILETEIDDLLTFDVGLMPLADDRWSQGKCGFKLIQYMACGLPVIASPIGVNAQIVEDGVSGFLAADTSGWISALEKLAADSELALSMGRAGRRRVEEKFCVQKTAVQFLAGVQRAIASKHSS